MRYTPPVGEYVFLKEHVFESTALKADDFEAILGAAAKFATDHVFAHAEACDRQGIEWLPDGSVVTSDAFKDAYARYIEGGWASLGVSTDLGGLGLTEIAGTAKMEFFGAANIAFDMYLGWGESAATMLRQFGTPGQIAKWLPKLVSGEWGGAMALTEPQCGTDLGLVKTRASEQADGTYRVAGDKIFITGGEHDLAENIVHFVLARIDGAESGSRGLSLFIVPKFDVDEVGAPTVRNSVRCLGVERKMGLHAAATCAMRYDDAKGWLLGKPGQGLQIMFRLMNHMRRRTGTIAVGSAEVAYQLAREHVKNRRQGRAIGRRATGDVADPLLVHADVRRTLVQAGAFIDAARAALVHAAILTDQAEAGNERAARQLDLLTPIIKAAFSDMGFQVCVDCQQMLGGHGYIRGSGVERIVRDARLLQIAEGANGIHGVDLAFRKLVGDNGAAVAELQAEIAAEIELCGPSGLSTSTALALDHWRAASESLLERRSDYDAVAVVATDYLRLAALVTLGWMWLRIVRSMPLGNQTPAWFAAKTARAEYFALHQLPETELLLKRVRSELGHIMDLPDEAF